MNHNESIKLFNKETHRFEYVSQHRLKEINASIRLWNYKNPDIDVHSLEERPKYYGCYLNPLDEITIAPEYLVDYVEHFGYEEPEVGKTPLGLLDKPDYSFFNKYEKEELKRILERATPEELAAYRAKQVIQYIDVVYLNDPEKYYCNLSENDLAFLHYNKKPSFEEVYKKTVGRLRGSKITKKITDEIRKDYLFKFREVLMNVIGKLNTAARSRGYNLLKLHEEGKLENGEYACFITLDEKWGLLEIDNKQKKPIIKGLKELNVVKLVDDENSIANFSYSHPCEIFSKEKRVLVNLTMMLNVIEVLHPFAKEYIQEKNNVIKEETLNVSEDDKEFFENYIRPLFDLPVYYIPKRKAFLLKKHFEEFLQNETADMAERYKYVKKTNRRTGRIGEDFLFKRRGMARLCHTIEAKYKKAFNLDITIQKIFDLIAFAHDHAGYIRDDIALTLSRAIRYQLLRNALYALRLEGVIDISRRKLKKLKLSSIQELQAYLDKKSKNGFDPKLTILNMGIIDDIRLNISDDHRGLGGRTYSRFCSLRKGKVVEEDWIIHRNLPDEVINRDPQRYGVITNKKDGCRLVYEVLNYNERDVQAKEILKTDYLSSWDSNASIHRACYNITHDSMLSHNVDFYANILQPEFKKLLFKSKDFKEIAKKVDKTVEELYESLKITRQEIKDLVNSSSFCQSPGKFKRHILFRIHIEKRVKDNWKKLCDVLAKTIWEARDVLCGRVRGVVSFFLEGFVMTNMKMAIYKKYGKHSLLTYDCIHADAYITEDVYEQLFDNACCLLKKIIEIDEEGNLRVKPGTYEKLYDLIDESV